MRTVEQGVDGAEVDLDTRFRLLAVSDDELEWAGFLRSEGGFLHAAARDHVGGEDLADDVVQETVIRLHRALPRYRAEGAAQARAWLRLMVRNAARDIVAAERARRRRERACGGQSLRRERSRCSPVDPAVAERLASCLRTLPEKQGAVIDLYYFSGMSFGDIAVRLGIKDKHVHTLHRRALARLRRRLVADGAPALSAVALIALLDRRGAAVEGAVATGRTHDVPARTTAARTGGRPARGRPPGRWWWVGGMAGSLAAAAILGFVTLATRRPTSGPLVRSLPLPPAVASSRACAAGPGCLWFVDGYDLHRVDPTDGKLRHSDRLRLAYGPEDGRADDGPSPRERLLKPLDLAWDDGRLWLHARLWQRHPNRFVAWDPATGRIVADFDVPLPSNACYGLAADGGRLWTLDHLRWELLTLDQADGRVIGRAALPAGVTGQSLAYADGGVWLWGGEPEGPKTLYRLDPATAEIRARLPAPTDRITGISAGGPGELWVVGRDGYAYLVRIGGGDP